jgi:hypothetical protein
MDSHFGRKGMWFALGVMALAFLCIVACLGAAAIFAPRGGGVWVQAPVGEGGAAPPTAFYPAHGIGAFLRLGVGLLFLGLLVLLAMKLVRWFFWRPWHAVSPYGYRPWRCTPQGTPQGEAEGSGPDVGWGPPAWRRHAWRHHYHPHPWGPPPWWGPKPEPEPSPEGEAGEVAPDAPASKYTGPME